MTQLEVLHRQPDFPRTDLSEENSATIAYHLQVIRAEQTYAEYLRDSLRQVHIAGHQALEILGVQVEYSEREYEAFCNGFAALEYTSQLVNPRLYDGTTAVRRSKELFIEKQATVDLEIADRYALWLKTHPTTHGVIVDAGAAHGETMQQLHARSIGAQIAYELQRAA